MISVKRSLLSDFASQKREFNKVHEIFQSLLKEEIDRLNPHQRSEKINRLLVDLIKEHAEKKFLLLEVLDFIDRVHETKIFEKYTLADFELWLNQFSGFSTEENYLCRALISGRFIPREEYQAFFPIGMGKTHVGSHVVTAHQSPDIDTMVASFWGWLDAFAARVGSGRHLWNVPGGPPESSVEAELLFKQMLHPGVFSYLSKSRSQLTITSFDLMTQKGFLRKKRFEHSLDLHNDRYEPAVILIDEEGYYIGDWRPFDVESIRQVIMLLNLCLRWIENKIHVMLFEFFSKEEVSKKDIELFAQTIRAISIENCDPIAEMTLRQQTLLQHFLVDVLKVSSGLACTLEEIAAAAELLEVIDMSRIWIHLEALSNTDLFDDKGYMQENRPLMFFHIEKVVRDLHDVFRAFRLYIDTLDIGFQIKTKVFGYLPQYLSYRTDIEEIQSQMGSYPYLTVNIPGPEEKQIPVGIIQATDLKKTYLGTASLRDFCNREETKVPPYFEVISVVDHHKSSLQTSAVSTLIVADAQSANSIVAQIAFGINDSYSLAGMNEESIEAQIKERLKTASSCSDYRILQRLYKKKELLKKNQAFFVDETREMMEYCHYLVAILDDTDLLTKMSGRDVFCVAGLLNRLKTLQNAKEEESVHFDDLVRDETFVKKAADRLLKNKDLYALYSKISTQKEKAIAENFTRCSEGKTSDVFTDTKTQNGCCRVGQTKMFSKNYPLFKSLRQQICDYWYQNAIAINAKDSDVDLHIHMISTVPGAEEVHQGELEKYTHPDEMWIWIPETDLAAEHLKLFLSQFKGSPGMQTPSIKVRCEGERAKELAAIFKESFLKLEIEIAAEQKVSYAVISYPAGTLNSRKALVSPFLPKLK